MGPIVARFCGSVRISSSTLVTPRAWISFAVITVTRAVGSPLARRLPVTEMVLSSIAGLRFSGETSGISGTVVGSACCVSWPSSVRVAVLSCAQAVADAVAVNAAAKATSDVRSSIFFKIRPPFSATFGRRLRF
jgi:hypothetical protein